MKTPRPLEALSAFGGGREDRKITTGRYPSRTLADRREILGPRLGGVGLAHGKLGGGMSKKNNATSRRLPGAQTIGSIGGTGYGSDAPYGPYANDSPLAVVLVP